MKQELEFEVPNPPDHSLALAEIPADVQKKWKDTYSKAFERAAADTENASERHGTALREANRLIKVQEPEDHEQAYAIPTWQLMKREEIEYKDLPQHAKAEVKALDGRKSGQYVRVYTTDGKEHFFPIPEKKIKAAKEEEKKGGASAQTGAGAQS
jgi:hypothetical protein